MGAAGAEVEAPENASAGGRAGGRQGVEFDNVMMAVNLEYARLGHPLKADDEVAFSPPVTGG